MPLVAPAHIEEFGTKLQGMLGHRQWINMTRSIDTCAYSDG